MNTFYHWIAKHKLLSFLLLSFALCATYTCAFLWLGMPVWGVLIMDAFLLLVTYCYTSTCYLRLLKKPLQALENDCDPFPLLQETELLLSYGNRKVEALTLVIDHCAALRNIGEYQKVYDALCALHIDQYAGTLPVVKCAYYNNLMDICVILGKEEQAELCFTKTMQIYGDLKNKKQKKLLESTALCAKAVNCFLRQENAQVVDILNGITPKNLYMEVTNALLCARAYLALNDAERAKEKLRFVVARGNKLYCAVEARQMLENCSK